MVTGANITFPAYNRILIAPHRLAPGVMSPIINR